MSHFVVVVVGDDVEKQLEPFWELDLSHEEAAKHPYAVFEDVTADVLEGWETDTEDSFYAQNCIRVDDAEEFKKFADVPVGTIIVNDNNKLDIDGFDKPKAGNVVVLQHEKSKAFFKVISISEDGKKITVELESIADPVEIPVKKIYANIDAYALEHHGYHKNTDGKYGYYTNPNSKWDWYSVGGRWTGELKLKSFNGTYPEHGFGRIGVPGMVAIGSGEASIDDIQKKGYCDWTKKNDIDIDGMEAPQKETAAKAWDECHMARPELAGEISFGSYADLIKSFPEPSRETPFRDTWKSLPEEFKKWASDTFGFFSGYEKMSQMVKMSREEYIECRGAWAPFALLWDGKWYEKGEMGWFGFVSDKEPQWKGVFKELWGQIPEDATITVVDCHV
jgi:hypothetical protein